MAKRNSSKAPPIHADTRHFAGWLHSLPLSSTARAWIGERTTFSVAFSEAGFESGPAELLIGAREGWELGSWLGGPAVDTGEGVWPTNADGRPLAHVANIQLGNSIGVVNNGSERWWTEAEEGLPGSGVLQVFHDLETYGYEAIDEQTRGWRINWLPDPDTTVLAMPPQDAPNPTEACQMVMPLSAHSVPSANDAIDTPDDVFEAVEFVQQAVQRAWAAQRSHALRRDSSVTMSHVYGNSQAGNCTAVEEVLPVVRPLRSGTDRYRLLLDIESWTTLGGWFGDASPLEVWIRQSDLDEHSFDQAWCLIRTD